MAVEGATTEAMFEAFVEGILALALRPGQVIVMDNLSAYKGQGLLRASADRRDRGRG
jgi:transposase